jgi:hypothetical protein
VSVEHTATGVAGWLTGSAFAAHPTISSSERTDAVAAARYRVGRCRATWWTDMVLPLLGIERTCRVDAHPEENRVVLRFPGTSVARLVVDDQLPQAMADMRADLR